MSVTIESLRPEEIPVLAAVMGKAYVTSPMNIAVLGPSLRRNEGMMNVMLKRFSGQVFVAKDDGQILGGMGMVEWPDCQLSPSRMLQMLPILPALIKILGWRITRMFKWMPCLGKGGPKAAPLAFWSVWSAA